MGTSGDGSPPHLARVRRPPLASVESEVTEKVIALWEKRVEASRASGDLKELDTFGWSFGSGKFDADWALAQLLVPLRATKRIDPDFLVIESLTELAPTKPREVVECLRHMVDGAREPSERHAWREEMEKSLREVQGREDGPFSDGDQPPPSSRRLRTPLTLRRPWPCRFGAGCLAAWSSPRWRPIHCQRPQEVFALPAQDLRQNRVSDTRPNSCTPSP